MSDKTKFGNNFTSIDINKLSTLTLFQDSIHLLNFIITSAYVDFNGKTRFDNNFNSIGVNKLSDPNRISWTSMTRFNYWCLRKFQQ